MKVINLDKFREFQTIELCGKQYKVYGVTVGMYLEEDFLAGATTPKDQAQVIIEKLTKITDIPREVMMDQPFGVLMAIIEVAQGIDPTEEKPAEGEPEKK